MATLAADTPRVFETGHDEYLNELPMIAADIIYEGAAVGELNDTGTYQPLGTGSTVDKFAGFAYEQCDNSAGAAGDKNVKVKQAGRVILSVTGVTAKTDVEKDVWATDDATFTLTYASGAVWIGTVARWISGTSCVVSYRAYNLRPSIAVTYSGQTTEAATDRVIFTATRPYYIKAASEVTRRRRRRRERSAVGQGHDHERPGRGHDLLTNNTNTGFDLNATANTVQTGAFATTAGLRKLNTGDRISIDFANTIQSTAGLNVTVELVPL
jgi:hypothetical protein